MTDNSTSPTFENKKFDVVSFNKDFEIAATKKKLQQKEIDETRLQELNKDITEKTIMNMSLNELAIDWKMSFDGIFDDFRNRNIYRSTLTSGNRLFHLGMTILIGILFFYLIYSIIELNKCKKTVVKKYYRTK